MKKDYINYTLVGLFVIAGLLLLFYMLYRVTGQQSGADSYFTEFYNVEGVRDGTLVTYGGYQVGQVLDVVPQIKDARTRYRVAVSVKQNWRIPDDSVAQIVQPRFISDKQIEISEGYSQQYLTPGNVIKSTEAVDVMTLVNNMGTELNKVIPQMAGDMAQLMTSLNQSAQQLATILSDKNRSHVDSLFSNADMASAKLVQLTTGFDRVNTQLGQLLSGSGQLLSDNEDDLRQSVIELRRSMDMISGSLQSIMYNLDASSRNMNEFSRQLRDNPSVLIGAKPPADAAQEAKP